MYPTYASAQEAGMSYEDYQDFVFNACRLYDDDPAQSWRNVGSFQQHIVDRLNKSKKFIYKVQILKSLSKQKVECG
ncbi:MAG: aminopeptidase [Saprospiraceae bacterium]